MNRNYLFLRSGFLLDNTEQRTDAQMNGMYRLVVVVIATIVAIQNCHGQNINLNDLLAAVRANNNHNNNNKNTNSDDNAPKTYSSTSVKTQEFSDLQSLMAAMKGGGNGNTANLDIASLLSKQGAQQGDQSSKNEKTVEISPGGEVPPGGEVTSKSEGANDENKNSNDNNGINLSQLAALLKQQQQQKEEQSEGAKTESKETESISESVNQQNGIASFLKKSNNDVAGAPGLQIETEGDTSKDGHSRFVLQRSPDGGLMLVPVKEETGSSRGLDIGDLMKKPENAVGGTNRQQLQLTSLV